MKKILALVILLSITAPVFATDWKVIFEKKYLDISSIERKGDIITFWTKFLRKDSKELAPGLNKPYWYILHHWNMDCANKKERIDTLAIYGLKGELIYSDDYTPEWNTIIPDTYADGFYNIFCSVPYDENPWLNPELLK
jgi:hypothetical protein